MAGQMKVGDLVKCDTWVHQGLIGVIIRIQDVPYCASAFVLLETGVRMIRLDNIKLVNERKILKG